MIHKDSLRIAFTIICLGFLFLAGCGSPEFAVKTAEDGASVPHPDEIGKNAEYVTFCPIVINPRLLAEAPLAGFIGSWPIIAVDRRAPTLKIKTGFAYFKKSYPKMPWKIPALEMVFVGRVKDLKNYLFILSNRDGMVWLFSPTGQMYSVGEENGYDFKKLESDPDYRDWVFSKFGRSLQEMYSFWLRKGWDCRNSIGEARVGTKEWSVFRKGLLDSFDYKYELDGEITASNFNEEQFKEAIKTNTGLTTWQVILKNLNLPVMTPTPEALGFSVLSSLVNTGFQSLVSNRVYAGSSASATMTREEMADYIAFIYNQLIRP
jgi:hypothetical protein